ncbi:efflux RND transporter periplasmic adaptor subunit [Mangrovibacterium diazotrophicum]|uniref:RND family efflux transporter MFP subunit n=1 Tax=Mangrovibacterium diazotrophicum TaxID=1261403 RepID=A0A419WAI9_9BACT|nr:efflux RND transporter periplasmic adaptor subunit [Mangrovibacterium diazotrophicum]RKD92501.1 RND family efflux transporter MFP subunit [Mangrovibacterium diazotrophicum]
MKTNTPYIMKKINLLFIAGIGLLMASCSGTPDNSPEAKRKQLAQYKSEVQALEEKITALEDELDEMSDIEYVNIKTTEAQPQLFEHFIEVTGKVEADQEVNVSPEGSGIITDILVSEGQYVTKGTTLATLNTDMLDKSIAEARISLDLANTTFERQQNLWDQKIGSEMQYLQAKTSKESQESRLESLLAQKEMAEVKAPVDGTVDVIFQKRGEIAGPQIPFAKVVNIKKIKIYGDVAESYLTKVDKNEEVFIDFPAIGRQAKSRIEQIGNYIDPNNRTFRVRVDLSNPDNLIKPNMISILKIRDYVADSAIVIPSLLIKHDFKGEYTFIVDASGDVKKAKKVYIKSGVSNNNMTEVTEGIEPGMTIISEGFDQVIDGTPVAY